MHQGGQVPGEQPHEPFRPAPPGVFGGEVRYPDARARADAIRQQHYETDSQRRGAQRRQVAEPAEGGERPGDAQRRQQHGPNAQELPEPESEPTPPAARHRSTQERRVAALGRDEGRSAVGGGEHDGLARDHLWGHLPRRVAEREALDLDALALAREQHAVLFEVGGQPDRFFRRGGGDYCLGPVGEGGHHGRRSPEHVDDDDAPAAHVSRVEAEWGEVDVDSHSWPVSSCGARSRNFVSTRPATKSGWRMTRLRNGMVVVTPSMINESSAWRIRASASSRELPCTITLASSES